ncbi:non-structural maintenance of chromosomes element 3 homolog [Amphiura filiformis]|uniref:non-structural maintenance of chromosomes element 3 homolog n=1 Tax=Amphiura filiformis TaxID=82378 RepID=UPI003B20BF7B
MPRGRPAAAVAVIESESEEDVDETLTQNQTQSLTQAQRATAQLSPEVVERKVGELVQFLLIQEQKKLPVKRSDISKNVLEKEYRACFPAILERAKVKLREAYGLELTELQQTSGKSTKKQYILLNNISSDAQANFVDSSSEDPKVGLLFIVLGLIFMQGGVVNEAVLWHFLGKLGIDGDEKNHDIFGDVKKLLTQEFTRQLYLEYTRIPNSEPPVYEFRWGQRSNASVSKMRILKFISETIFNMEPSVWLSQWQEACGAEGIPADAGAPVVESD